MALTSGEGWEGGKRWGAIEYTNPSIQYLLNRAFGGRWHDHIPFTLLFHFFFKYFVFIVYIFPLSKTDRFPLWIQTPLPPRPPPF